MKVRVLRSALDDLSDGRRFYDERVQGIGSYFFDSLFSEIDSLSLFGGVHRVQFGFPRLLAKRFPFAVYYRILGGEAVVFRVLDCPRDPNWIQNAVRKAD